MVKVDSSHLQRNREKEEGKGSREGGRERERGGERDKEGWRDRELEGETERGRENCLNFKTSTDKNAGIGGVYTSRKALAKTKEYPLEVPNETSIASLLLGANCKKP